MSLVMKRNRDVLHLGLGLEIREEKSLDHETHLSLDDLGLGLVTQMGEDDLDPGPVTQMGEDDLGLASVMKMVQDGSGLVERGFLAHFLHQILSF